MSNRRVSWVLRIASVVASAVLLILSFPGFNFYALAWFGLVPLFFAIEDLKLSRAFLVSYLAGVLFFLGTIWWLIHVTLPGMFVVVLYLALYFGSFGIFCSFFLRTSAERSGASPKGTIHDSRFTKNYSFLLFAPAAWVTLEYARTHLLTGFGWNLLVHSQSANLPFIQIADITGAHGVSFLIVLVNAAIFIAIRKNRKNRDRHLFSVENDARKIGVCPYFLVVIFLLFVTAGYGIYRLNNIFTGDSLRVSVVQGNIPQNHKWDASFREEIIATYESLTRQAAKDSPDLIVWPETSVPGFLESEQDLFGRVKTLVREVKTPLLVGTVREKQGRDSVTYYNSAYLFSKDGAVTDRYDKIHLVPFGEYIPFKNALKFVEKFAPVPIGDCAAGKEYKVFSFVIERSSGGKDYRWKLVKKVKFSALICFEDIFPEIASKFVKNGALFLINITNDAWYKKSAAAYQHAQSSIFRAVENRVNVVRSANTGLSCFIDQKGRVTAVVSEGGKELFVKGFKAHDIILTRTKTFYASYGDVFAYVCILLTLFSVVIHKVADV
jgi:apolipoprotein N-acyltransferase